MNTSDKTARVWIIPALTLVVLVVGGVAHVVAGVNVARRIGNVGLWLVGAPLVWTTIRNALRGQFATDLGRSGAAMIAAALGYIPPAIGAMHRRGGDLQRAARCGSVRERATDVVALPSATRANHRKLKLTRGSLEVVARFVPAYLFHSSWRRRSA
ncbi:MAG TPA: hypothetical protein VIP11_15235 [Gemmatimonadaceae bacterium]